MSLANRFVEYHNFFDEVISSSLERSSPIFDCLSLINLVDVTTAENKVNIRASVNSFSKSLDVNFEAIKTDASNVSVMKGSFEGLFKFIETQSGLSFDNFLSSNNIQVNQRFANLSSIFGREISDSNIG